MAGESLKNAPEWDKAIVGRNVTWHILVYYGLATCRFEIDAENRLKIMAQYDKFCHESEDKSSVRPALRGALREAIVDNLHINADTAKMVTLPTIMLCATSDALKVNPNSNVFIVEIQDINANEFNFRFVLSEDIDLINATTEKIQSQAKRRFVFDEHGEEKTVSGGATKPSKPKSKEPDPSLSPPPRPNPERFLTPFFGREKLLTQDDAAIVRDCLEKAPMFVWKSREIEDRTLGARREILESLFALAQHSHLSLPYPRVWAETRDWMPFFDEAMSENVRVPAHFGIAASQEEGGNHINCWVFCEFRGEVMFSPFAAVISLSVLASRYYDVNVRRIAFPNPELAKDVNENEHLLRAIARAGGKRILELLLLLSTRGVEKKVIKQTTTNKRGKNKKNQRHHNPSKRDYTIIRVPYFYRESGNEKGGEAAAPGRWIRPHLRRAHMWGKNTRPLSEQRWIHACLVNAARVDVDMTDDEGDEKRREYRVM